MSQEGGAGRIEEGGVVTWGVWLKSLGTLGAWRNRTGFKYSKPSWVGTIKIND